MLNTTIKKRLGGALFMLLAYLVIQTFVVIVHEFTHSTTAWLLGYTPTPFTVVWGNPITVRAGTKVSPTIAYFRLPAIWRKP